MKEEASPFLSPRRAGSYPHYLVHLAETRQGLAKARCPRGETFDEWDLALLAAVLPPTNVKIAGEGWEEQILSGDRSELPPLNGKVVMKVSQLLEATELAIGHPPEGLTSSSSKGTCQLYVNCILIALAQVSKLKLTSQDNVMSTGGWPAGHTDYTLTASNGRIVGIIEVCAPGEFGGMLPGCVMKLVAVHEKNLRTFAHAENEKPPLGLIMTGEVAICMTRFISKSNLNIN